MIHHRGILYLLPWLIPLAAARPVKPRAPSAAAPIQVPVNTSWLGADGATYTLSGTLTLQAGTVTPPPDPVGITGLSVVPGSVLQGTPSVGTITLNRAPVQPIQVPVAVDSLGLTISSPVAINPGQTTVTFPIGTAAAGNRDFWYTLQASYNGSKQASLLVRANGITPPPPPGAGDPSMTTFLNGDGSPIIGPLVYGQEVRILGSAFGATPGKVFWQGATLTQILSWSDTIIRVKLPVPVFTGATQFGLQRSDGVRVEAMVPLDVPARVPGSAKRR